ncbi:caspase family protein [Dyadobacter fermentans]|uniref:Peptidase C14 caspase catalytic subunit p20 n=1 Tax=Dyadobacter fermentans (strain ATCC 700827 / DSM 18053 / CIP 107007 / KCTC 52180 / NS114) TaxID=471854 RepID=C6W0A3_DYAFD|nr:caspase family protein [Dyadobacter fermentans]ACT91837.1 peptidase C14 caspase catalytic subunit p20 [Dyadobacter fermentans DSM 18053]
MIKLFTIFAALCLAFSPHQEVAAESNAPSDTLYLRTREKKVATVKEVYPDIVKYNSETEKDLLSIPVKELAGIVYANGTRDLFNAFDAGSKPDIKWLTNISFSDKPQAGISACILNEASNITIEVNGAPAAATRSFRTVPAQAEGCLGGVYISQQITLREGKNNVRILAGNASGNSSSDTLTIVYSKNPKRIALVVGNSSYQAGSQLQNPENDAKAITRKLTGLGFEVIERIDARQGDLRAAVAAFGSSIQDQDLEVALFYYAGHGIQVGGRNYLVPVDINPRSEMELKVLAVSADDVLDQMSAADEHSQRTNIMILDACRDNPLSRSWTRGSGARGLASMSAPPGSLITFSTKPGFTALDGDGTNSPYTAELLKALDVPGLRLEDIFRTVRIRVMELTNRQQVPMENSLLTREVILNKSK